MGLGDVMGRDVVDAVVIGRNEGVRLVACLAALQGQVRRVVYVDSGSTDGSVTVAEAAGAVVVALHMGQPFTAARARNAGLLALGDDAPDHVQFVDGDCAVQPGWVAAALQGMADHPGAVVVCGRRRERFAEASIYNALCDVEWNTPVGQALSCGGDALMSYAAVMAVGGYRDGLIAGEEPELCVRLRGAGGQVWRIDAEMTLHDAAIVRLGQWWRRARRAGHAYAEVTALHGLWRREMWRAVIWAGWLPVVVVAGFVTPWAWLGLLVYPVQVLRLGLREGWAAGGLAVLGKFAEAQGVLRYCRNRLLRRRGGIIEYK
jgi:glycosyltransferase involved in cell wall biosynthesis